MRKSLALTISLIIMCLFAVGCSQNELKPNDSIATEISKIQNTGNGILTDTANIFTSVSKGYKIFREKLNNSF